MACPTPTCADSALSRSSSPRCGPCCGSDGSRMSSTPPHLRARRLGGACCRPSGRCRRSASATSPTASLPGRRPRGWKPGATDAEWEQVIAIVARPSCRRGPLPAPPAAPPPAHRRTAARCDRAAADEPPARPRMFLPLEVIVLLRAAINGDDPQRVVEEWEAMAAPSLAWSLARGDGTSRSVGSSRRSSAGSAASARSSPATSRCRPSRSPTAITTAPMSRSSPA